MSVRWRQAEYIPQIFSTLSEMPRQAILSGEARLSAKWRSNPGDRLVVSRREDGKLTVLPEGWKDLRVNKEPTVYELAIQGDIPDYWEEYLEYGNNLIQAYWPDFDYSESEEQAHFLLSTLKKVDQVAGSINALRTHLEYVEPGKKSAVAPLKDPQRDVKAAILSDVLNLSSLEIGKELGFKSSNKPEKRENRTAAVAARRGRELLQHCFGVEGWQKRVQRIREARARWLSLEEQPKKQIYYLLAERHDTSIAEEEHEARQDGFDHLLDEWAAAVERDDRSAATHISTLDLRFTEALRQYW